MGLHVAWEMLGEMRDGVYFADLSSIRDPGLVAPAIAEALGVRAAGGRPLPASVSEHVQEKSVLLLLDNFEQVTSAAPIVSRTLLKGLPEFEGARDKP